MSSRREAINKQGQIDKDMMEHLATIATANGVDPNLVTECYENSFKIIDSIMQTVQHVVGKEENFAQQTIALINSFRGINSSASSEANPGAAVPTGSSNSLIIGQIADAKPSALDRAVTLSGAKLSENAFTQFHHAESKSDSSSDINTGMKYTG